MATRLSRPQQVGLAAVSLLLVLLVVLEVAIILGVYDDDEWQPLGPYPVQDVLEINEAFVRVVGTKCAEEDVTVRGTYGWMRVEPPGFSVTLGEGTGGREAGCHTQEFRNDIPSTVSDLNEPGHVWIILGSETPVRDDGTEGVPLGWQTEEFVLP